MKTIKFHKRLGQVEVISSDDQFTIVIDAMGTEQKLMTPYMNLQDEPFEIEAPKPIVEKKKWKSHSISSSYASRLANQHAQSIKAAEYFEHKF